MDFSAREHNGGVELDHAYGITDLKFIPIIDATRTIDRWRVKAKTAKREKARGG